jgi:hypothetical protein
VILSDDGHELVTVNTADSGQHYIGDYQYWYNTDGGIIGRSVAKNSPSLYALPRKAQ